jgi:hypothetical protein
MIETSSEVEALQENNNETKITKTGPEVEALQAKKQGN